MAVPWLKCLLAGLSTRRPGFDLQPADVVFVVDDLALGQVLSPVRRFPPVSVTPPELDAPRRCILLAAVSIVKQDA